MSLLQRTVHVGAWRRLTPLLSGAPRCLLSTGSMEAKKTCLYDLHTSLGGRMVDFAGYLLPVQYGKEGVAESHRHIRTHCGLFDVSHMMQTSVRGRHAITFIEALTVADVQCLPEGAATLTVFTNQRGGIIDDLIVTKVSQEELYVVSNAGCREKDWALLQAKAAEMRSAGSDVSVEEHSDRALLALQGPEAVCVLQELLPLDLQKLPFMRSVQAPLKGFGPCRITRCGYTGEDGVELSVPLGFAPGLAERLLSSNAGEVRSAGLGARDSLRLEAGLCLYGNDLTEDVTPVEAALAWLVAPRRRKEGVAPSSFPGAEVVLGQLKEPASVKKKRVGLLGKEGPPPRKGATVWAGDAQVGEVTSGCPSPSLGVNVAMAYIKKGHTKIGTSLSVLVRGKKLPVQVAKMPFVPAKYYVLK